MTLSVLPASAPTFGRPMEATLEPTHRCTARTVWQCWSVCSMKTRPDNSTPNGCPDAIPMPGRFGMRSPRFLSLQGRLSGDSEHALVAMRAGHRHHQLMSSGVILPDRAECGPARSLGRRSRLSRVVPSAMARFLPGPLGRSAQHGFSYSVLFVSGGSRMPALTGNQVRNSGSVWHVHQV